MTSPAPRVKCLLVDDREDNLLVLAALMRTEDVEVLEARSGAEALDLLLRHEVALALLDVQMPEMDGFELAELMRGSERTRQVPIIFVTAGVRDERRIFKGYESGAVDFLYKPIDPHILHNKAGIFFQLYRQKQQLANELAARTATLRLNEMFTAVMGHDLRSPLNAITTAAQVLQHQSQDEQVRRTAARMLSSAKRMARMIEDMLDLARARLAGGIPLQTQPVDFASLLQRVVHEQQAAFPDRWITLTSESELTGEWDPDRLAQVVSNVIGNALQHGDPGSAVDVSLSGPSPDAVVLTVSNAGRIPADVLPHIFDPFRGVHQPAGRYEGLGLGLYIVQQIIQAHGGHIHVECGGGRIVFTVEIPRASVPVARS